MELYTLFHVLVLVALVISAVTALSTKDLLASAIGLAVFSLLLSLEFYILQAPDVAIAEAGIGAGLTTAVFIMAIRGTSRKEESE